MQTDLYVESIAEQFCHGTITNIRKIEDGAINETYVVHYAAAGAEQKFILQHMSAIFPTTVMDNLATIQPVVTAAAVQIPDMLTTTSGSMFVPAINDRWWRALTYMPGETINDTISLERAVSAGALIGRFHTALADTDLRIIDPLPHFHDTPYIIERLNAVADAEHRDERRAALLPLVAKINEHYTALPTDMNALPKRIIHADLKVSNIRFDGDEAVALIDIDTIMRHNIAVEMGDALRSWCGINGEDNPKQVFDTAIANAAFAGYLETATFLEPAERAALIDGIAQITIELAARFLTDAFEERYFRLQPAYPDLYTQTKAKAANQLALLEDFIAKRDQIVAE